MMVPLPASRMAAEFDAFHRAKMQTGQTFLAFFPPLRLAFMEGYIIDGANRFTVTAGDTGIRTGELSVRMRQQLLLPVLVNGMKGQPEMLRLKIAAYY